MSVNDSVPLSLAVVGGSNVTETWQLPPAASMPAPVHISLAMPKPGPETLALGAANIELDLFVKVTGGEVFFVPVGTLPKLIFLGDTLTFGGLVAVASWARALPPTADETAQVRIAIATTRAARQSEAFCVFNEILSLR
jgi:hypothetical protein